MKHMALVVALGVCGGLAQAHFISDDAVRAQVARDFAARRTLAAPRANALFGVFNESLTVDETEALQFLYAYMPISDLADYDGAFFLEQVRFALRARQELPWGVRVPEDVFRHFVLPYRVNNEDLDSARRVFFAELKDRVKNLSMADAALEVNHWCHEKMSYRGADPRTSAPLASVRTALGRCGEESTLCVTALRAVGIPARQCYTPHWAHSDSNHAWVEVWIDGTWRYLGACEPDARLDMGWFAVPATRAMMVHSTAFGRYTGTEETNWRTPLAAKVNMLHHYAPVKTVTATVTDGAGRPVADATVKFKIYNYAQYNSLAEVKTDAAGVARLTVGAGDLLVWACKGDSFDYAKVDVRETTSVKLALTRDAQRAYTEELDIRPPAVGNYVNPSTPAERAANTARLAKEDAIRASYLKTFPTESSVQALANENFSAADVWHFIHAAEGNHAEIAKFIAAHPKKVANLFVKEFLARVSAKDLRDTPAAVLEAQLCAWDGKGSRAAFLAGVLPARIGLELLRPWRPFLKEQFTRLVGPQPTANAIHDWIAKNIVLDEDGNYLLCPMSPRGVFELRRGDAKGRDVLFVAACRACGIPALLEPALERPAVFEGGRWRLCTFGATEAKPAQGTLVLTVPEGASAPQPWTQYTLAKFHDGDYETLGLAPSRFPARLNLEAGSYLLSTGNRYSDGETRARLAFFTIKPGEVTTQAVVVRPLTPRVTAKFGTLSRACAVRTNGVETALMDFARATPLVLAFLNPSREPTRHLLRELGEMRATYETWGGTVLLVVARGTVPLDPVKLNLPKNAVIVPDADRLLPQVLRETQYTRTDELPFVLIMDAAGRVTFRNEGYRIGTADLIYRNLTAK